MIKNDYIMRLIEQFARVISRLMGMKDVHAYQEALRLLRDESRRLVGVDGTMLELLDLPSLRRTLHSPERMVIAGRILEEMTDIQRLDDENARATANSIKAVALFTDVLRSDPDVLDGDIMRRAHTIVNTLGESDLTWDDSFVLFGVYESLGLYDRAEDSLWTLGESGFDRDRVVEAGLDFYDRLLKLDDTALIAGNLPREEVIDGREEWIRGTIERNE